MINVLLVGLGGAAGSICRYLVGIGMVRALGPAFPWGTLSINVAGSFLIGVLAELILARFSNSMELRLLLITGFLGGFTTFSAFSLDVFSLFERGEMLAAFGYVAGSILLSLLAVFCGIMAMRAVL